MGLRIIRKNRQEEGSELDGAESHAQWRRSKEAQRQKMAQLKDDAYFAYDPASGMSEEAFTQQFIQQGMNPGLLRKEVGAGISQRERQAVPRSPQQGILSRGAPSGGPVGFGAGNAGGVQGILAPQPQLPPQGQPQAQGGSPQCMPGTTWNGANCVLSAQF